MSKDFFPMFQFLSFYVKQWFDLGTSEKKKTVWTAGLETFFSVQNAEVALHNFGFVIV